MNIIFAPANTKGGLYKAILYILLGIVVLKWPGNAVHFLIRTLGLLFLVFGTISLTVSYTNKAGMTNLMSISGIGSILLGLLLLFIPSIFAGFIMFLLGALLVLAAISQFSTIITSNRRGLRISFFNFVTPILALTAGVIIIINPFETIETIFMLFGISSIFYGITDLWYFYKINKTTKYEEVKTEDTKEVQKLQSGEEEK